MNKRIILTVGILLIGVFGVFAQNQNESFWVAGNCDMCEERIEAAALALNGVDAAEWNTKNKMLTVSFDNSKVKLSQVHAAVATAGHDTKLNKANKATYEALPACCQYERTKSPCTNTRKSGCCGRG